MQRTPLRHTLRDFWRDRGQLARRWMAVAAVLIACGYGLWKYATLPTRLSIAVGPAGSERQRFVDGLAKALAAGRKPVRLRPVVVDGSAEAAKLLDADKVQLAVVRSDEAKLGDARAFAIVDQRAVLLVARAEAQIGTPMTVTASAPQTVGAKAVERSGSNVGAAAPVQFAAAALVGKRIVVGADQFGSNSALIARLLAHSGLAKEANELQELPVGAIAAALASQRADIAAFVVDPAATTTRELLAGIAAALGGPIALGGPPAAEGLVAIHRDLIQMVLAPGVFGGLQSLPVQALTTVAITDEIVGDSDLPEATGAQLVKALLETRGRMVIARTTTLEIEPPPTDKLRRYMPHAGVVAHASDKSTSFLETYSDQIWLGLFALGFLGSSLAGLAGWLGLQRPK